MAPDGANRSVGGRIAPASARGELDTHNIRPSLSARPNRFIASQPISEPTPASIQDVDKLEPLTFMERSETWRDVFA